MARPFRCLNCTTDFWGDAPTCKKCGADATQNDMANTVISLRTIHFMAPHAIIKNRGCGVLACGQKPTETTMHSAEPDAVNCPNCRLTDVWKTANDAKQKSVDEVELKEETNGS
jgi:hypothetical protein